MISVSLESEAAQQYALATYPASAFDGFDRPAEHLGFHDLGLYEFLFLALVLIPVFVVVDRRKGPEAPFGFLFVGLYMPVRFGLDFLRVADATYAGLTPAQWVALTSIAVVVAVLLRPGYRPVSLSR